MIQEQTAKVYQAHRLHYLLSTEQVSLQELTHLKHKMYGTNMTYKTSLIVLIVNNYMLDDQIFN